MKYICIYCLKEEMSNGFSSEEHILPQFLGKFINELVLNDKKLKNYKVCNDCNQFFGNNLDIMLGRGSVEGILRRKYKKSKNQKDIKDSIKITLAEGLYKGLRYYLIDDKIYPIERQVGFKKKDSAEYDFYKFDSLPPEEIVKTKYDLSTPDLLFIIEHLPEDLKTLHDKYSNLKLRFDERNLAFSQEVLVKIECTITMSIKRAIAKIIFNYLAYFNSTETLIHNSFDKIRNFIRYGDDPKWRDLFEASTNNKKLALHPNGKFPDGYFLIIDSSLTNILVGRCSLGNSISYEIILTTDKNSIPCLKTEFGHFSNPHSRKTAPLFKPSLILNF